MMRKQPFAGFLHSEKIKKVVHHYLPFSESASKFFPSLSMELRQAGYEATAREWTGLAMFMMLQYFMLAFIGTFAAFFIIRMQFGTVLMLSLLIGVMIAVITFLYVIFTPKLYVNRRAKEIEKHLPFALRQLLIHVRGGTTLYNSIVAISNAGYGALSEEFKKAVKQMSTGKSDIESLEKITQNNPSLHFRRIMWQILNALKTGSDVGGTLKEIVDNIVIEQRVEIKKYGAQLNPLALLYMVAVIIFPTLGIIMMVVLNTFIGGSFDIKGMMILIIMFLSVIQFVFIGVIKSKRPIGV